MKPSPCGSVRADVAGVEVMLRASGALWLEAARVLVVADLHLEKGSAYAAKGQMLPPYDTAATLARLGREIDVLSPATVVLLGDTLHDSKAASRIAKTDRERLALMARALTLVWVVGNHDRDGAQGLPGDTVEDLNLAGLDLRHEPLPGARDVTGHLHPCARIRGRGGSLRRRCFVTDADRVILPAFGAYAGGLNVRDEAFAQLFVRPPVAVVLGADKAHPVAWARLAPDR